MDKQNDLFLLLFTLSKLNDKRQIIRLFYESLSELFKPYGFVYSEKKPDKAPYFEDIASGEMHHGYLACDQLPPKETIASIQNALQVLALILEKHQLENDLKDRARSFESIAQKRLDAIKASVIELENSRKESANLIGDLKNEIAERKKIEKELRESQEKYQALFFNSHTVMILIDAQNGQILEGNPAASAFYGWTLEEMKTLSIFDINPLPKQEILQIMEEAKKKKQNDFHFIHKRKDGSSRNVDVHSWPIPINNKTFLFAIIHDTTRQMVAEKKLEENERRFRSIVENSFEGIGLVGDNFTFTYVNENFARLLQYPVKEIIGRTFIQFFAPESREIVTNRHIRRRRGEKVPSRYEVVLLRKDGKKVLAEISASTFKDLDGNPMVLVQFIDITEKRKSEEKLRLQRYHQQIILDASPTAIWFKDTKNNIIRINKSAAIITQKTTEEVEGKPSEEIFPQEAEKYYEDDLEVMKSGKPKTGIIEPVTAEGKTRWLRTDKLPWYDEDGNIAGVVAFSQDITSIKEAEETIKKERDQAQRYLDIAGVMFGSLNTRGEITLINKKGCEILGYDNADELVGKNWLDVCLPDVNKKDMKKVFREQMSGNIKALEYFENPVITKSGEERLIAFNNTILVDPDGKITGVLFSGEDITEREKAKKSLLEAQYHLSTIYNTVGDIIYYLKVEAKNKYRFMSVNEMFCQSTGLTMAQVIGKYVDEIIPEPSLTLVLSNYKKAIQEKTIIKWEEVTPYPTGLKTGEVSISPVFNAEEVCTYLVGSVHDVTDQKKAEEEIKKLNTELEIRVIERTAELEKANKELEELNDVFVGREMRIIELKEEVERLKSKLKER